MSEEDIEEMFKFADKDKDGKISFLEFQIMIKPQKPDESNNNNPLNTCIKNGESVKKVTISTEEEVLGSHDKEMLISI